MADLQRDAGPIAKKQFLAALQRGPVGPTAQNGIKTLATPEGDYTHELKIAMISRIAGRIVDGVLVFDWFLPKGFH